MQPYIIAVDLNNGMPHLKFSLFKLNGVRSDLHIFQSLEEALKAFGEKASDLIVLEAKTLSKRDIVFLNDLRIADPHVPIVMLGPENLPGYSIDRLAALVNVYFKGTFNIHLLRQECERLLHEDPGCQRVYEPFQKMVLEPTGP